MVEDAVAAVANSRGEAGMVVSLLNVVSGISSEAVRVAIPAVDSMRLVGESLLELLVMSVRLIVGPLLPEVRPFRVIDLVKLPSGAAGPIRVDKNKEVELTLM